MPMAVRPISRWMTWMIQCNEPGMSWVWVRPTMTTSKPRTIAPMPSPRPFFTVTITPQNQEGQCNDDAQEHMYGNQDSPGRTGPENEAQNQRNQCGDTQYIDGDTY